jgi:hypothetical protein
LLSLFLGQTISEEMMTKDPTIHSSHYRWRIVFLLLVVVPFLPEVSIYVASVIAKLKGCEISQETACSLAGMKVSDIISTALDFGALASLGFAAAWLILCLFVINSGWKETASRRRLALATSIAFAILPYLGPFLAIGPLFNQSCPLNGLNPDYCHIFGGQVDGVVLEAIIPLLLALLGAPIAVLTFIVYVRRASTKRSNSAAL